VVNPADGIYISIEPFHVFRYVDEQAFRFNNRNDETGDKVYSCSLKGLRRSLLREKFSAAAWGWGQGAFGPVSGSWTDREFDCAGLSRKMSEKSVPIAGSSTGDRHCHDVS